MRHATRRKWDVAWMLGGVALVGGAASIGALAGDTERIGNYYLHADVAGSGPAQVVEVIDYDFGPRQRHGILRDIPDVDPNARIVVSSPTAPAQVAISSNSFEVKLKVGDPARTISNRHRYRIEYPISTLVEGSEFFWDAVGTEWTVPINNAEIRVTADRELDNIRCFEGVAGSSSLCTFRQVDPGHVVVHVSGLSAGDGVSVAATLGAPLGFSSAPAVAPTGRAGDPGTGWLLPGLVGVGVAAVAGGATSRRVRRAGREQVWEGGPADAAFGPPSGQIAGVQLVDYDQLAEMATIEFESPRGLSAAAGGIIHAESVKSQHQIAWLIEAAIRDEVILEEDGKDMRMLRGPAVPHPAVARRLGEMFTGREVVELGSYDSVFATAWKGLGTDLDEWSEASGFWDPAGARRQRRARILGAVSMVVGLPLAFLGGLIANRAGAGWLAMTVIGALAAGAGLAAMIRSWELAVRTPEGSARWLQIESFRRFIAASEARHAEAAAKMGLLRHYTAWAVALGELRHWQKSVEAAAAIPGSSAQMSHRDFAFVAMAPSLSSATAQTFTAPSSSGSGGGGGGVGGGGGGGGGGSW